MRTLPLPLPRARPAPRRRRPLQTLPPAALHPHHPHIPLPLLFPCQPPSRPHLPFLPADLEWKLTYVGSAESEKYDQTLDSVFVGPVAPGQYRFVFQADPPDFSKIPPDDVVGVTILLLTCSYKAQEFLRVGYYVNNEYLEEELRENPPAAPLFDRLVRNILADKPRVTKFPIDWDEAKAAAEAGQAEQQHEQQQQEQQQQQQQMDDGGGGGYAEVPMQQQGMDEMMDD